MWSDNDDNAPSKAAIFIEARETDWVWLLQVRGLGVIVMRASAVAETGKLIFHGVSTFTNAAIGYDPGKN